jgi:hypothetical protein
MYIRMHADTRAHANANANTRTRRRTRTHIHIYISRNCRQERSAENRDYRVLIVSTL